MTKKGCADAGAYIEAWISWKKRQIKWSTVMSWARVGVGLRRGFFD
jgi:hypothetical protein